MGKGGGDRKIPLFYYSIAFGVCRGPIDAFNFIRMKDKVAAWVQQNSDIDGVLLEETELFGGEDGEGGPAGYVDYRMGSDTQVMSTVHASKHDDTPENLPGYRGLAYLFFHGRDNGDGTAGFRWIANSSYFPEISVGVTRLPKLATVPDQVWPIIGVDENGDYVKATPGSAYTGDEKVRPTHLPDANPASMIFEALTADWGLQELTSSVEIETFQDAGQTLLEENFGLSMIFTRQMEVEKFIGEILDHIRAVLFEHPETGKWNLKLIRDDYELSAAVVLNPSNSQLKKLKTRTWDNTINEIIVSYTDPNNEESETVSAMNNANIAIVGGLRSEERDYFAVRNPWLAQELAQRDVDEASRTLKTAEVTISRSVTGILPGSVVRLDWPEEDVENLYCRVMGLETGDSKDRTVKLELTEDIFAAKRAILHVQEGVFPDPVPPVPLDEKYVFSPPVSILQRLSNNATSVASIYPETAVAFLAGSNTYAPTRIDVVGDTVLGNGSGSLATRATITNRLPGTLGTTLTPEARSTIPASYIDNAANVNPVAGMVFAIGDTEEKTELIMLDSDNGSTWSVLRAVHDTLPLEWDDSTVHLWHIDMTSNNVDDGGPITDVEESYYFLPVRDGIRLDVADAEVYTYTPLPRAAAPYRPANPQIGGNGFGVADYSGDTGLTSVPFTWANRNRLSEDAVAVAWDDAPVTPELNQTTILRFWSGILVHEVTGLTGNSYDLDPDDLPDIALFEVEFIAVRDGIESVYNPVRRLILPKDGGWDYNWGQSWGQ